VLLALFFGIMVISGYSWAAGGSISVTSSPGDAEVFIDGASVGIAPVFKSNVASGNRVVVCKKNNFNDFSETVTVNEESVAQVQCKLTPQPTTTTLIQIDEGTITIITGVNEARFQLEGPDLFLGGGSTWNREIPAGEYFVTFSDVSGYTSPQDRTIEVIEGRSAEYSMTYEKKFNPMIIVGIVVLVIAIGAGGYYAFKTKGKAKPKGSKKSKKIKAAPGSTVVDGSVFTPRLKYNGPSLRYEVEVENRSTKPIGEVLIAVHTPSTIISTETEKAVQTIAPRGVERFSFDLRPGNVFGSETIVSKVNFYNYRTDKRVEASLEAIKAIIDVPTLRATDISESLFKKFISSALFSIDEQTTKKVPLKGEELFNLVVSVIQRMGLFALPPSTSDSGGSFRGLAGFYGEDIRGLKYAVEIEVLGDSEGTQLLIKAGGMRDDALAGFYHKILDNLEGRTRIKKYIDSKIVQDFYWKKDSQEAEFLKSLDEAKTAADKDYNEWVKRRKDG
jgi:hypothetical protein